LPELVDLYGHHEFDVLCLTDHVVRLDDPMTTAVDSWTWPRYLTAVCAEARRALDEYSLLVIPGLELTDNDHDDPDRSAHALAIGLERHVAVDEGIVTALEAANEQEQRSSPPTRTAPATRRRCDSPAGSPSS
jgi:putative intracellular protease/amidase